MISFVINRENASAEEREPAFRPGQFAKVRHDHAVPAPAATTPAIADRRVEEILHLLDG
jgi:hypothetical protein